MAQEFYEVNLHQNNLGKININLSVLELIARINVGETKGVYIVDGSFKKGVNCFISKDGLLKLDVNVQLTYGTNAERTSRMLQEKIYKTIKQTCDIECDQIDINVIGFQFQ